MNENNMETGKITTIQLNTDKAKKRTTGVVRTFIQQYGKYVGAVIVSIALVIVCGVSLADRIANRDITTGVMMTVADLTKDREAFSGNEFADTIISYGDMINTDYNTEQYAQLELAEQQIDEILTAKRQDNRDQAAMDALSAVHSGVGDPSEYDAYAVAHGTDISDPETTEAMTFSVPTYVAADVNGQYQYLGEYLLTAYCPCPICCGKWSNMENPVTASGARPTQGWTIAAPKEFPFGTKIMIDGQIYEVQDRGGAINGKHFDVYFNTHQDALNFAMRTTSAYLVVE